jgi:mono/diheme cytochrome c family protein
MIARILAAAACCLLAVIAASPSSAQSEGEVLFGLYCASCHGTDARGGGPVAGELKNPPPSLREIAKHRGGAFSEPEIISYIDGRKMPRAHGSSEMPVWGTMFGYVAEAGKLLDPSQQPSEEKVEHTIISIVKYLASIQDP